MSQATTAEPLTTAGPGYFDPNTLPEKLTNTSNWKIFMWLFLCQDAMMFFTMFAGYLGLRIGAGPAVWTEWNSLHGEPRLGIPFTAGMTFLLICSSVTMVQSIAAIQRDDRKKMKLWLGMTILGGVLFLLGQVKEYTELFEEKHMAMTRSLFDTTFFMLTSFHGFHVFCGVVYLSSVWLKSNHYSKDNFTHLEIAGLYWHFVDLVWIILFTLVYLI